MTLVAFCATKPPDHFSIRAMSKQECIFIGCKCMSEPEQPLELFPAQVSTKCEKHVTPNGPPFVTDVNKGNLAASSDTNYCKEYK